MNDDDAFVNLIDLLGRLEEPPIPEPVSMMPQTAGWWILLMLLVAALAGVSWRYWRHRRANAYRRAALAALDAVRDDPAEMAIILRRTALAVYPRRDVAGLTGDRWTDFLEATGGFPRAAAPVLQRAAYAPQADAETLRPAVAQWIRAHRSRR